MRLRRGSPGATEYDGLRAKAVGLNVQALFTQLAALAGCCLVGTAGREKPHLQRHSEVCYWPNLGHGRFGPRVTLAMPSGSAFDSAERFDPARLRLADLDGSGTTDIVYLGGDGVAVWRNQAGNRLAPPERVIAAPAVDQLSGVSVLDLEADGTGCLVWSAGLAADSRPPVRYVRLTCDARSGEGASVKPHLLATGDNGW